MTITREVKDGHLEGASGTSGVRPEQPSDSTAAV